MVFVKFRTRRLALLVILIVFGFTIDSNNGFAEELKYKCDCICYTGFSHEPHSKERDGESTHVCADSESAAVSKANKVLCSGIIGFPMSTTCESQGSCQKLTKLTSSPTKDPVAVH